MTDNFDNDLLTPSEERRTSSTHPYGRRSADYNSTVEVSEFRLTLKELGAILAALFALGTTLFAFNTQLDRSQAESNLRYELINTRVKTLEDGRDKADKQTEKLIEQFDDLERTTTQLFQRSK